MPPIGPRSPRAPPRGCSAWTPRACCWPGGPGSGGGAAVVVARAVNAVSSAPAGTGGGRRTFRPPNSGGSRRPRGGDGGAFAPWAAPRPPPSRSPAPPGAAGALSGSSPLPLFMRARPWPQATRRRLASGSGCPAGGSPASSAVPCLPAGSSAPPRPAAAASSSRSRTRPRSRGAVSPGCGLTLRLPVTKPSAGGEVAQPAGGGGPSIRSRSLRSGGPRWRGGLTRGW